MVVSAPPAPATSLVVIGKESVGKTQLLSSLAGKRTMATNFRGSTVDVEKYRSDQFIFWDTPGIFRTSDTDATRRTLEHLESEEHVLVVAQATHLDDDLRDLLPLVVGKRGAVVVTFWDRVQPSVDLLQVLAALSVEVNVSFIPVDARHVSDEARRAIDAAVLNPKPFMTASPIQRVGWCMEPQRNLFDRPFLGPLVALLLLVLPSLLTLYVANTLAGYLDPAVHSLLDPIVHSLDGAAWPALVTALLAGDYGILTMGPFLFVWAVPTIVLYAIILGTYKASGLVDRMNTSLEPLFRPVGLTGRDLVRVTMGLGCNVPAVISTRACSSCSRGQAISAIAFGAACSYQLPATLAVFSAADMAWLALPFLLYLGVTTLIYLWFTCPKQANSPLNILVTEGRTFLTWPDPRAIGREAMGVLTQFLLQALPVFLVICLVASLLAYSGVLGWMTNLLAPLMTLLGLPPAASLPVVMGSIRKDGILLFTSPEVLAAMSPVQILAGTYFVGVFLPCLVTTWTIAREQSWRFAGKILARQAVAAILFTMILTWPGKLFGF